MCGNVSENLTLTQDYPSMLAQGVYAAFCDAFPDSYRQFDERFKEDIICLVYEWAVGKITVYFCVYCGKMQMQMIKRFEEFVCKTR